MDTVTITINGQKVQPLSGTTILEAARTAGIYIPTLCYHPDLPPGKGIQASGLIYQGSLPLKNALPEEKGKGCGLCVVEVDGDPNLVASCAAAVREGMAVTTENQRIRSNRQENLIPILTRHRHACLTCAQQEGCSRSQCSSNVPQNERCCTRFGHCELQNVANYIGISPSTPKWSPGDVPIIDNHPLFIRDYNLCIGCTRCVRACRDLRGIEAIGFVYDDKGLAQVGTLGPTLGESACKFCTACVEVCPTGALVDKAVRPGKKAEDLVPCKEACPAHIDVPGYLRLVAAGKRDEAHAVIREKVPFPGILGRVCVHPCEEKCRRGEVNEPISICALKRYAADGDKGLWKRNSMIAPDTAKKVAVIGSGPAGLTASFYLRKRGHSVSIFEARSKAGGMMRYGIPRYRLPDDLLDKEIGDILSLGIQFKPNQTLGKEVTFAQLKEEGYQAVFLGIGAQLSRRIPLEGSDSPDVLWGVDFLARVAEGEGVQLQGKVIVIGGGNVAVDVALTAKRCGAKEVTMICLETREEMPSHPWEIEGALKEGVKLISSWGPHKIVLDHGRITGMEIIHCVSVFDDECVFSPKFDETRKLVEADQVILAIGQASDLSFLETGSPIAVKRGLIVVDEMTLETGMKGVYAGGDVAAASGAIIHAVAAGRKGASSIDKALGGTGEIEEVLFERGMPSPDLGREEGFAFLPRVQVPELDLPLRHQGFQEVSLGYAEEPAVREAKRCLQCDLRLYIGSNPSPPEKIIAFKEDKICQLPEAEGVFQLYDVERNILAIKGTANLRKELLVALNNYDKAVWFDFEEDKMYSKRESELIQKYLQEHGKMPGGGADEDLF
jgi:NADPH-dependent glutamate synthase beta subunit-like oxidoreductase/ferredoxin